MEGISTKDSTVSPRSSVQVRIEVSQGDRKQQFHSAKTRLVIGSVESADIRVEGSRVAPIHALIEVGFSSELAHCTLRVVDLASPFGVSLNGVRVLNEEIRPGDSVRIGDASLKFTFSRNQDPEPLPEKALLLIDRRTVERIFDYEPSTREALEVVYSFNGSIFEVRHFTRETEVVLSADGNGDFTVPPVLASGREMKLLQKQGGQWVLNLDGAMGGVLYQKGRLIPVEELKKGQTQRSLILGSGDFLKLQIGALTWYVSQTVAPPAIVKQYPFSPDPFLLKSFLVSLPVSILMFSGIALVSFQLENPIVAEPPPPPAPPPGFVMTYPREMPLPPAPPVVKTEPEAPKNVEVDLSKPLKPQPAKLGKIGKKSPPVKRLRSDPKEGEGARIKGVEGSRGVQNAPRNKMPIDQAFRPSEQTGAGRGGVKSQTQDQANVQMMKSALDSALDAIGGSGIKIGESGNNMKGVGVIDSRGAGGRLIQGAGKGGGGSADQLLGGAGKKGTGAGRSGTGKATDGRAGGIISGGELGPLTKGDPESVIYGSVDPYAIEQAIQAHSNEFRYCYERELNAGSPGLAGKIMTTFVLGPSGLANQAAVKWTTVKNAMVEKCVLQVIRRITEFPKPIGGATVSVSFPFIYQNLNK
jgi:hypothetical protein